MNNVVALCQLDARWAKEKIGKTKYTIGGYGCTLTALTMLLNYVRSSNLTPSDVNKALTNVNGFTSEALLIWSRIHLAYPEVKWVWRGYNYENLKVANYIYAKRLPVLVQVAPKGWRDYHWVLFIGWRKMIDPLDGKIKSTNTYPLTGYSLIDRS